jgi:NADH-quinone oxidoreductase subunit E
MGGENRALNQVVIDAIRACFPRYPTRRAALLPALHLVNEHLGYVPPRAVAEIAELLELPAPDLQDALSFYGFFAQDKPQGRVRVWVCRSLSCAARGGEELLEYVSRTLGIRPGETTADGRITLQCAECLGACDFAPAVLAGDTLYRNATPESIDALVRSHRPDNGRS